jgi:hypothetical protein
MRDDSKALTQAELELGWHWCYEWDGLLVGPNMDELRCCNCTVEAAQKAKARLNEEDPLFTDDDDAPSVINWDCDMF